MSDKKTIPSLSSLSNTRQNTTSLSQLKQKMQNASISQQQPNKPVSSLQSLANKSGPSLASLAQKKSSLSGGKTSLSHLATRTKPSTLKSTASLLQKQQETIINKQPIEKKEEERIQKPEKKSEEKQEKEEEKKETPCTISYISVQDPLWAEPSEAAQFLFQPQEPVNTEAQQLTDSFTQSIQSIFYNVMKASSNQIKAFNFDVPSPDDIVLNAQSNRGGGAAKKT